MAGRKDRWVNSAWKAAAILASSASLIGVTIGAAAVGTAGADPGGINGHNCAGVIVSGVAEPGLGAQVAVLAHAQEIDNFGIANCGQEHRKNP